MLTDRSAAVRRFVARGVILVYLFLLISLALTVWGKTAEALRHGDMVATWLVAFVPLTVGFVLAVKGLGAGDRGRSPRRATLAAAPLLAGLLVLVGSGPTGPGTP